MGLLMWVFPETSVLDYGYADMDTLFSLGPYVFIFSDTGYYHAKFRGRKKIRYNGVIADQTSD
jgi:ABC-2 type transport system permease protein